MTALSKYQALFRLSWQNSLVYRTSFILWRFRNFLSSFMSLTVWSVIYAGQDTILSYQKSDMINYVFLISLLQSIILTTALGGLASDIYNGKISDLLLKPLKLFGYFFTQDVADKLQNIVFSIVEIMLLAVIFHPTINWPSLSLFILFLVSVVIGVLLYLVVNLLFGSIGFWSPEVWAPRFLFFMFLDFTAGKLYPLNILPKVVQTILFFTPFPYFSYIQTQIFLQKVTFMQALGWVGLAGVWAAGLWFLFVKVWHKGLKEYNATGL